MPRRTFLQPHPLDHLKPLWRWWWVAPPQCRRYHLLRWPLPHQATHQALVAQRHPLRCPGRLHLAVGAAHCQGLGEPLSAQPVPLRLLATVARTVLRLCLGVPSLSFLAVVLAESEAGSHTMRRPGCSRTGRHQLRTSPPCTRSTSSSFASQTHIPAVVDLCSPTDVCKRFFSRRKALRVQCVK